MEAQNKVFTFVPLSIMFQYMYCTKTFKFFLAVHAKVYLAYFERDFSVGPHFLVLNNFFQIFFFKHMYFKRKESATTYRRSCFFQINLSIVCTLKLISSIVCNHSKLLKQVEILLFLFWKILTSRKTIGRKNWSKQFLRQVQIICPAIPKCMIGQKGVKMFGLLRPVVI